MLIIKYRLLLLNDLYLKNPIRELFTVWEIHNKETQKMGLLAIRKYKVKILVRMLDNVLEACARSFLYNILDEHKYMKTILLCYTNIYNYSQKDK